MAKFDIAAYNRSKRSKGKTNLDHFAPQHMAQPAEGSAAEEATETPAFEKKEDAGK